MKQLARILLLAGLAACSDAGAAPRPTSDMPLIIRAVGLGDTLRAVYQFHSTAPTDTFAITTMIAKQNRYPQDTVVVALRKYPNPATVRDSVNIIPGASLPSTSLPWQGGDNLRVQVCATGIKAGTQPQVACIVGQYVKPLPLGPLPVADSLRVQ